MKRASLRTVLCALMCAVCLAGCADKAEGTVEEGFVRSQMDAYVKLFKASARENREGNLLISPLSVQVALGPCRQRRRRGNKGGDGEGAGRDGCFRIESAA